MKRAAFTMLELVMVILVIGILTAIALPRLERDLKQEAADNVLSAIRYTQHLALLDDKHEFDDPKWQQRFWHIYFGTCESQLFYVIGSDDDKDAANNSRVEFSESALDPSNGKHMWALDGADCTGGKLETEISPTIFIGKNYGVASMTKSGACDNQFLGFDHLGRPYDSNFTISTTPDNSGYMANTCTFTFTMSDNQTFSIQIEPETGYAYIVGQNNS